MNLTALTKTTGPHVHTLIAAVSPAYDALRALEKQGLIVRFVRGGKATTVAGFFDEVAAALQFPPYFGQNWDACNECLSDLAWLPASSGIVVVITDAEQLLKSGDGKDMKILNKIIADAAAHLSKPSGSGTKSKMLSFHAVLQAESQNEWVVQAKWPGVPTIG